MDTMTQTSNLHASGLIDADEASKVHLKWAEWEREIEHFNKQLMEMTFEANFRKTSTKKSPYFWVPEGEALTQAAVDKMMSDHEENEAKKANQRPGDSVGDTGRPVGENLYYKEKRGRK
jgi:hypothetical protein